MVIGEGRACRGRLRRSAPLRACRLRPLPASQIAEAWLKCSRSRTFWLASGQGCRGVCPRLLAASVGRANGEGPPSRIFEEWAIVDLNQGPSPYQEGAGVAACRHRCFPRAFHSSLQRRPRALGVGRAIEWVGADLELALWRGLPGALPASPPRQSHGETRCSSDAARRTRRTAGHYAFRSSRRASTRSMSGRMPSSRAIPSASSWRATALARSSAPAR